MDKGITINQSPNFLFILTLIFIVLKATGTVSWSWWWVLSPLWLPFVFAISAIGIAAVVVFLVAFIGAFVNK